MARVFSSRLVFRFVFIIHFEQRVREKIHRATDATERLT